MAIQVYRCSRCGREVLVRIVAPLSEEQVRRRIAEEMRPDAAGPPAQRVMADRLRDDIWVGLSDGRTSIPRETVPERCPSCDQPTLVEYRFIDE